MDDSYDPGCTRCKPGQATRAQDQFLFFRAPSDLATSV
jgi:hypothetical protein